MISDKIKEEIEHYAEQMPRTNAFFLAADNGTLGLFEIKNYLNNIYYLFKHTVLCLKAARDRALEMNEPDLAAFFEHKITEEFGHEQWARQDLERLGTSLQDVDMSRLNPTLKGIVQHNYEMIQANPKRYLIYMFFAEYFTLLVSPKLLSDFETKCGVPRTNMTALSLHVELDVEHTQEDIEVVDRFIGDPDDPEEYLTALRQSAEEVDKFLAEVALQKRDILHYPEAVSGSVVIGSP